MRRNMPKNSRGRLNEAGHGLQVTRKWRRNPLQMLDSDSEMAPIRRRGSTTSDGRRAARFAPQSGRYRIPRPLW
jgi:hypothetical protein